MKKRVALSILFSVATFCLYAHPSFAEESSAPEEQNESSHMMGHSMPTEDHMDDHMGNQGDMMSEGHMMKPDQMPGKGNMHGHRPMNGRRMMKMMNHCMHDHNDAQHCDQELMEKCMMNSKKEECQKWLDKAKIKTKNENKK